MNCYLFFFLKNKLRRKVVEFVIVFLIFLEGCLVLLDFVLIVDILGSISRWNFKKLLEFIEEMVDGFDILVNGICIVIVEYSIEFFV